MPASKVLETSLVCTRSARFVLCSGINDEFIRDKVEKKFLRNCKPRSPFIFSMMTVVPPERQFCKTPPILPRLTDLLGIKLLVVFEVVG
jgi:hypothetical protein